MSEHNVDIIISPVGATPIAGFMNLVKEKKILLLFPSTGSPTSRDPSLTNLIHFCQLELHYIHHQE